jgi:hypothetical protein
MEPKKKTFIQDKPRLQWAAFWIDLEVIKISYELGILEAT